eukprot:TRINITY_DN74178_c0_g1_i1.p1 TRINITY_DN74178_c0_g1~~TRINITY_DN74178_c0_g1_i1.p1  ORF type:complete len:466 (+),score=51.54 TRINITY_DN74178_c0_g1_i1:65-1462(+)
MPLESETKSDSIEQGTAAVPFLSPAHKVHVTDTNQSTKSYFVQENILSEMGYFEAHMARWKERGHLELRLPEHCTHAAFEAILMRLLSFPKPAWSCFRWSKAIGNSLASAVAVSILSKMLLVNWVAAEIVIVVHSLTQTAEQASWVEAIAQRSDLLELRSVRVDGTMPEMSADGMRDMLHSAAKGHQAGRDFGRDLILWRRERGHNAQDVALLIDVLENAESIVGHEWRYGTFPLPVFNWIWELISECALPNVEHFNAIVKAFNPMGRLTETYSVNRNGQVTLNGGYLRLRVLASSTRMRLQEAFIDVLRAGFHFYNHDKTSNVDFIGALRICFGSSRSDLFGFSSILENHPDTFPSLLNEGIIDAGEPFTEHFIDAFAPNSGGTFWQMLSPALISSFTEPLQLRCIELCDMSHFGLAKLDVLRGRARECARSRLARTVGELDTDMLDFVRGKRRRLDSGNASEE